jgi:hypothetical protein
MFICTDLVVAEITGLAVIFSNPNHQMIERFIYILK